MLDAADIASYFALAATALLPMTAKRMWYPGARAASCRPFLQRVPLWPLRLAFGPLIVVAFICRGLLWKQGYHRTWTTVMFASFTLATVVLFMIAQRFYKWRSKHFDFKFQRDRFDEVSLHVSLSRSALALTRRGYRRLDKRELLRAFPAEFDEALAAARTLPNAVRTLTVTTQWFAYGRHAARREALRAQLGRAFPDARIEPAAHKIN